jgi:hypothetical protein
MENVTWNFEKPDAYAVFRLTAVVAPDDLFRAFAGIRQVRAHRRKHGDREIRSP